MVDEKEKTQGTEKEGAVKDNGAGDKSPAEKTLVDMANEAAERLKAENDRTEALIARQENLEARRALGGRTEGAAQVEKPQEESPADYAAKALKGQLNK